MYDSLSNDMKQLTNVSLKPLLSSWTMDTQSISTALATLPQYVFPPQHARIPITPANVLPIALPPLTLYLFLCYLVRRPNTRPIRLALFPVVVPWLWWLTFHVAWFPERTMAWNVPFTTTGVLFVTRAAEYTLSSTPALKLSERTPGDGGPAHSYSRLSPTRPTYLKVYYALSDSNELVQAHRGVGWTFGTGQGLHLPPLQSRRPTAHRGAWLKSTAVYDVMLNYLVVDAINTWWRTVPAITDPRYTPQAYEHLSLPMRVLVPVSVMLVVRSYMSMWYSFAGVLDVLGGAEPSTWPVLFGEPWKATSLHALWSTEWHQLSRHLFLTTLGYPLRALFGTPGLTLGAFASSGLYHKYVTSHPIPHPSNNHPN
ncbi:hypothetical protein FRB90_002186 [Tulasnella sp. 427]|nr:hypothetical protein FRB90_002186 [Tulasnella sp. 427]